MWNVYSSRSPTGFRAYVGGLLYVEGIIVLLIGAILLFGYWPPYADGSKPRNPISLVGMVISMVAVGYIVLVGIGLFIYNLLHPPHGLKSRLGLRHRIHRYASSATSSGYLFDESIKSADEADEAIQAHEMAEAERK